MRHIVIIVFARILRSVRFLCIGRSRPGCVCCRLRCRRICGCSTGCCCRGRCLGLCRCRCSGICSICIPGRSSGHCGGKLRRCSCLAGCSLSAGRFHSNQNTGHQTDRHSDYQYRHQIFLKLFFHRITCFLSQDRYLLYHMPHGGRLRNNFVFYNFFINYMLTICSI